MSLAASLAQSSTELADAIIRRHGGRDALSMVDLEVVAAMVRVFSAMRSAAPAELPRLVDSLTRLESMLPDHAQSSRSPLEQLHAHIAATHGPGARAEAAGDAPTGAVEAS
jgi:hypothetical protein